MGNTELVAMGYRNASTDKINRRLLLIKSLSRCSATRIFMNGVQVKCKSSRTLEIDHIQELRHGGLDVFSNLQVLCHACHSQKTKLNMRFQHVSTRIPF